MHRFERHPFGGAPMTSLSDFVQWMWMLHQAPFERLFGTKIVVAVVQSFPGDDNLCIRGNPCFVHHLRLFFLPDISNASSFSIHEAGLYQLFSSRPGTCSFCSKS